METSSFWVQGPLVLRNYFSFDIECFVGYKDSIENKWIFIQCINIQILGSSFSQYFQVRLFNGKLEMCK